MLMTVTGPIKDEEAGVMLPHEHILVGFIEDGKLTPEMYDRGEVIEMMKPLLMELKRTGCRTFVDCAPEYLGRDPVVLKELSIQSGLHFITNTGFYKAPYLPPFVYDATEQQLADIWIREARDGIHDTDVKPGYIKIALNDGRINDVQQKILRAAIRTSIETNLVIQSHTIGGETALHAADIMRQEQFPLERFIWVHAQSEPNLAIHEQLVKEGMWISIDAIGWSPYEEHAKLLQEFIRRGLEDHILLSQDTGWYNVGQPKGGNIRPFHPLFTEFVPFAIEQGIDKSVLDKFNTSNPQQAMRIRK